MARALSYFVIAVLAVATHGCKRSVAPPLQQDPAGPPDLTPQALPPPDAPAESPELDDASGSGPNEVDEGELDEEEIEARLSG